MARVADGTVRENHRMSNTVRKRVVVRGRVQGVFFRSSVRERARAHGVSGWACNRADGALEVVLEGPPEAVDRVVRFCETGPSGARVDGTAVNEAEPEGIRGFEIR
jgi:acylphosphatase